MRDQVQIVTIVSPAYEKVGVEMVRRVKRFTGHEVKVIRVKDEDGFEAKLNLDKWCRRPMWFVDADMWPLREWNPTEMHLGTCLQITHDSAVFNPAAFPHTDCHVHGLDWQTYGNTGLFALDLSHPEHREVFKVARASWKAQKAGKKAYVDKTDQAHIIHAYQTLKLPLQFLPEQYNCYLFGIFHGQRPYIPREIINLHGAGIPAKNKYARMKVQASVLGQKSWPMHDAAILWEHARQFHLR